MNPKLGGPRNGILSLTMKDKAVLYAAYMPFVKNGGLFIATNKKFNLGDDVFLLLNLMEEPEKIPVAGKVIWVTPRGARATGRPALGFSSARRTSWPKTRSKPIWPVHSIPKNPLIPCKVTALLTFKLGTAQPAFPRLTS